MPGELIDIFNENMEHIGTADRAEVHAHGYWHQSFHCWLIQRIDEKLYVLFQRRGPDKKLYPKLLILENSSRLTSNIPRSSLHLFDRFPLSFSNTQDLLGQDLSSSLALRV